MRVLEVDMGNSRSKWRLRDDGDLLLRGSCSTETFPDRQLREAIAEFDADIKRVIVAAVCSQDRAELAKESLGGICPAAEIRQVESRASQAGVISAYAEPGDLGVDRWLVMLAAYNGRDHSQSGILVASCGTALTVDMVNPQGVHEGGYILPGLDLMRQSLLSKTGKISFEPGSFSSRGPGTSTADAVQNGAVHGALSVLENAYHDCNERWGLPPELWLTGGNAALFKELLALPCQYEEDLVLDGLGHAL